MCRQQQQRAAEAAAAALAVIQHWDKVKANTAVSTNDSSQGGRPGLAGLERRT